MADSCCAEGSNRMIIWCAGAANVGQMTNQIAVELSKEGFGRLFCLAGIAAHRSGFVRSVKDSEDMLVLDGCPIACTKKSNTLIPFSLITSSSPSSVLKCLKERARERKHGPDQADFWGSHRRHDGV